MSNLNIFFKLKFLLKKPKVVIVAGNGRKEAKQAICQVLKKRFNIGDEVLIFEEDLTNSTSIKKSSFLIKNSCFSVLAITHIGDISIENLVEKLPNKANLILNYDDETLREIKAPVGVQTLKFGFSNQCDIFASDIKLNGETNLKINYKGYVVPVWLNKVFGKEQIYAALSAVSCGLIFGLNLVEISQALKDYQELPKRS